MQHLVSLILTSDKKKCVLAEIGSVGILQVVFCDFSFLIHVLPPHLLGFVIAFRDFS
jgi:hypothetical protein